MTRSGSPKDGRLLDADDRNRRVPSGRFRRRVAARILLLDLREVDLAPEVPGDGVPVEREAVRRNLRHAEHPGSQVAHELACGLRAPLPDPVADEQLRDWVYGREDVLVPLLGHVIGRAALLLLPDVGPYLVALDELRVDLADERVMEPGACLPHVYAQLPDGVPAHVCQSLHCANAGTLDEGPENPQLLLVG
jgi:hypothetical protein